MASLRKKKDGRYYIDYRDGDGTRRRESIDTDGVPVRDKILAEAYFTAWVSSQRQLPPATIDDPMPRIAAVLDYYRDVHLHATNAASATHRAAQTHCEEFASWCRRSNIGNCQQISREVMSRWSASLQLTRGARTARNYLTTIRTAINVAVEAELLPTSPIRGRWVLPKVDPVERHPLSLDELREVLTIFADSPIIRWICLTGNRPSDARTLTFRQVDVEARTVDRGSVKARALRKYEISAAAAAVVMLEARRPHRG